MYDVIDYQLINSWNLLADWLYRLFQNEHCIRCHNKFLEVQLPFHYIYKFNSYIYFIQKFFLVYWIQKFYGIIYKFIEVLSVNIERSSCQLHIYTHNYLGEVDFKVAGANKEVTALQMYMKISGISFEIIEKSLEQAKAAGLHILEKMNAVISEHCDDVKDYAPGKKVPTFSKQGKYMVGNYWEAWRSRRIVLYISL